MKKQIKETAVMGKRGPQRVITYGYDTQVNGLDVIMVIGPNKEFCIVQAKSGISIGIYFTSATKAIKFADKYLKDFDFTRNTKEIQRDKYLYECICRDRKEEGL